ncbi:hypothetical protein CMO89_02285 [Candidatus Woesearchaeota archaeon]|nr:hypothetical protein [Candidatus Woesearchaeota archaeon]|tara:strand:- start:8107 stop:8619 length:513 start_codon:yes stop_codon:yes gene_type:complete
MGQEEILNMFFEHPTKEFQIRGIARALKMPKTTVSYHINQFLKEGLIVKHKKDVFPSFKADETSETYRFHKRQNFLNNIIEGKVLDYIDEECNPKCIVLFGSFAKAEYDTMSDIDIFVQAKATNLELVKFEKKLKHSINIFYEDKIEKLSSELLNNIVNGVKLRGFLKVK